MLRVMAIVDFNARLHSRHFERLEGALVGIAEQIDRLSRAIARARTEDLTRLADDERRLQRLETRRDRYK